MFCKMVSGNFLNETPHKLNFDLCVVVAFDERDFPCARIRSYVMGNDGSLAKLHQSALPSKHRLMMSKMKKVGEAYEAWDRELKRDLDSLEDGMDVEHAKATQLIDLNERKIERGTTEEKDKDDANNFGPSENELFDNIMERLKEGAKIQKAKQALADEMEVFLSKRKMLDRRVGTIAPVWNSEECPMTGKAKQIYNVENIKQLNYRRRKEAEETAEMEACIKEQRKIRHQWRTTKQNINGTMEIHVLRRTNTGRLVRQTLRRDEDLSKQKLEMVEEEENESQL